MKQMINKEESILLGTDMLGFIQCIATTVRGQGTLNNAVEKASVPADILAQELECTTNQAVLFSIVFDLSFESGNITVSSVASYLKCPVLLLARHTTDLEELTRKKLLRKEKAERSRYRSGNDLTRYCVPAGLIETICTGQKIERSNLECHSLEEMLVMAGEYVNDGTERKTYADEAAFQIRDILCHNTKFKFSTELLQEDLGDDSLLMIMYLSVCLTSGDGTVYLEQLLSDLFIETGQQLIHKRMFKRGNHELLEKGLVNFEPSAFRSELIIRISEEYTGRLFAGEQDLLESGKTGPDVRLILHEIIPEKQMFYTEEEARDLSFLEQSLMPANFRKLEKKLTEKGLHPGVNILFYGPPGTGKTETVYQLARRTGRDIRQIDISETKSMWFGESEKIIKKKFDQYRALVKTSKIAPILFFNEADGIFGKRKETTTSNTGQTENAIQNIILQEMETLNGIMIATTNMAENLDKAFERRFLYKILFEKPDMHARCMIWETRLPSLSSDFIRHLAEHFDLTGGQIDNVVRKVAMHQILKDEEPDFTDILKWCREENMHGEYTRIGFRI